MKAHDIFGVIPRQLRDYSIPESDTAKSVNDGGTWKTKRGEAITADSLIAFEVMRAMYFPHIPVSAWVKS